MEEKGYSDFEKYCEQLTQWCEEKAKEYFASKEITKRYPIEAYVPETDISVKCVLLPSDEKMLREFIAEQREEFLKASPEFAEDKDAWDECLYDAFTRYGVKLDLGWPWYDDADINYVDLEHPINTYLFDVLRHSDAEAPAERLRRHVDLKDEQYCELLAALIEHPELTMDDIYFRFPETYRTIKQQICEKGVVSCAIPTEIKEDAEKILEKFGEEMPHW